MRTGTDAVFAWMLLGGLVFSMLVLLTAGVLARFRMHLPAWLHLRLPPLRLRFPLPRGLRFLAHAPRAGKPGAAAPDLALFPPGTTCLFLGVFATFAGALGTVCRSALGWGVLPSWVGALTAAPCLTLLLAGLVWWYFLSGEGASEVRGYTLIGTVGHVSIAIPEGGVGAVAFEAQGKRVTMPAKSEDGATLDRGASVMVVNTDRHLAVVEPYHGIL
jgi:hypothetical protein